MCIDIMILIYSNLNERNEFEHFIDNVCILNSTSLLRSLKLMVAQERTVGIEFIYYRLSLFRQ